MTCNFIVLYLQCMLFVQRLKFTSFFLKEWILTLLGWCQHDFNSKWRSGQWKRSLRSLKSAEFWVAVTYFVTMFISKCNEMSFEYYNRLPGEEKVRYKQKLDLIGRLLDECPEKGPRRTWSNHTTKCLPWLLHYEADVLASRPSCRCVSTLCCC